MKKYTLNLDLSQINLIKGVLVEIGVHHGE
jgi:hypothetical protein